MPFAYYDRLSRRERAIYDRSDKVPRVDVPLADRLRPLVGLLRSALEQDRRRDVEAVANRLCLGITRALGIEDVQVVVLAVRPTLQQAELHGLYTRDGRNTPRIRVWMRTVHYKRVVAFRTFLRTLLHEVCHHVDYTYLKLDDSFHTEGFFKRESSLFYQLVPREDPPRGLSSRDGR
ncbi:MAG TPA: hypothetical protein VIG50_06700 [Vicinamibacteria bacterium]|jgi:hypothetical protein